MTTDARPTSRLTTGAVGNFLIGAAMLIIALTGMATGVAAGSSALAGIGLVVFLMFVGGGVCASLGWFGLGRLYGGLNGLAGIFSILLAILPVALIVAVFGVAEAAVRGNLDDVSPEGALRAGRVVLAIFFGIPALAAIVGGIAGFSAKAAIAKPAGLVLLLGGLATAGLTAMTFMSPDAMFSVEKAVSDVGVSPSTLMTILVYVGYYGSAAGFILTGITMLAERAEPA